MNSNRKMTPASIGLTLFALFALWFILLGPAPMARANAPLDGNTSLGQSKVFTLAGGVRVSGVGLRGVGSGDINLSGIPAGSDIFRAYLYWATLGFANTYTQPLLNGQPVPGQLIGTTGDTCWGVQNNFVYRADVTQMVDGNGTYTVSGLPGNLASGNDSQGASLVVLYRNVADPLTTIVINDGAVALNFSWTSYTDTIQSFTATAPVENAQVTYLVGDGQVEWDAGNITFNGASLASGVFSGVDGPFWGSHTFDVTALVSGSSASTTLNDLDPNNPDSPDCLLWAATVFSVTVTSPQTTNQLTEAFNQSLFGDVTASGVGLRGLGQGVINLSGIPYGAVVNRAFLYWATLGASNNFANPQLDGHTVEGQLIGTSADTCWAVPANYVFRADVTGLVNGNGDYTISGLPYDLLSGNDSQGASLVVVYSSPGLYRTVIINDGAVTLDLVTNKYTDVIGPFYADQPNAQVHITYLIGDGQSQWDSGSISFEGYSIAGSVFNGTDGDYWGTLSFDVSGLITEPDATTTIDNDPPGNLNTPDCLLWAASILSVQTEQPVFDHFYYAPLISK